MGKILICDDERDIVSALKIYLTSDGYEISEAYNGKDALAILENEEIDLLLLDVMMPELDGLTALLRIREKSNIPVIMISAKSEDNDKILGLNLGADDYVTKPFNPMEVLARVRSQLRRYKSFGSLSDIHAQDGESIRIGGIEINNTTKTVQVDGEEINLTPTEFDILLLFMKNPGKVFSPKAIYETVWKDPAYGAENTVAVHIRHLREKIEAIPAEPRYLKVVWGQGYKIDPSPNTNHF